MRILLDTSAFLWSNIEPARLSSRAASLIQDGANDLVLSAVSAWEVAIKHRLGQLELPQEPGPYVSSRIVLDRLSALPIEISHALQVSALPLLHRDPFDRLLIAQAQLERLPILTSDPNITRYDVEVIW